ncbi:hypothetical protein EFL35_03035 [Weissella paramesenteroides]|uniref:hypothetical protein n=1 Tax=Weissella paramesenteroides TaxID=1249 RepID=UPI00223BF822|nr:hypothetical protein [Weissella paramesenteroides]MCS9983964.1 hypothetical protein [Weissella paramesenteroides]MCS9998976.1 hypothetical protein [Weissella paramesenteroides]MCT0259321.1 hypothetical protein [Weissella paramesenteroides]
MVLLLIISIIVITISLLIGYKILSRLLVDNLNKSEQLIQLKLSNAFMDSESIDLKKVGVKLFNDVDLK